MSATPHASPDDAEREFVLPLTEERAVLAKQVVETGRVRISTRVEDRDARVRQELRRDDVIVERVPIDEVVDESPVVRREGDTTIYPVVEEILVVQKRFLIKEELRVTSTSSIDVFEQDVTLRAVRADVECIPTQQTPTERT